MNNYQNKRAPSLGGWVIAAGAGFVAAAVAYVVGHFSYPQSGFVGAAIFLLVGLILGMYWGSVAAPAPKQATAARDMPKAEPVGAAPAMASAAPAMAAPAMAAPATAMAASVPAVAAAAPAPAALISAPMTDAAPAPAKVARVVKPKAEAKPAMKPAVAKVAAKPVVPTVAKVKKPDGPLRLSAPRKGKADDLKEIEGIGPALEKMCHSLGFYHFDQIAGWSDADVAWIDANMKTFKGRIARDKWIAQSKIIVADGLEAFRVRAQTNNY